MSTETDIALLKQELRSLRLDREADHKEIAELKRLDNQRVRAGLVVMGSVVVSLVLYIWNGGAGK